MLSRLEPDKYPTTLPIILKLTLNIVGPVTVLALVTPQGSCGTVEAVGLTPPTLVISEQTILLYKVLRFFV